VLSVREGLCPRAERTRREVGGDETLVGRWGMRPRLSVKRDRFHVQASSAVEVERYYSLMASCLLTGPAASVRALT
jgi:hypothetical protein